jgi:hypothetical protein
MMHVPKIVIQDLNPADTQSPSNPETTELVVRSEMVRLIRFNATSKDAPFLVLVLGLILSPLVAPIVESNSELTEFRKQPSSGVPDALLETWPLNPDPVHALSAGIGSTSGGGKRTALRKAKMLQQ